MTTYSSAQIVADACSIAKVPGFLAQGGRALNYVLDDLSLHRNLKVNLINSTINLPAYSNGPLHLESNYLRTYDLFFNIQGEPYFLNPCSLKEFDAEVEQNAIANYPYEFATDLSGVPTAGYGLMYVYPQSSTAVTMTHRYYLQQAQITTPESSNTVPWFSDQDYLTTATAMRLMRISDDDRYENFLADCDRMLLKHLVTEGDEQQVVKSVQLDPRRFRVGGSNRPTKLDPF